MSHWTFKCFLILSSLKAPNSRFIWVHTSGSVWHLNCCSNYIKKPNNILTWKPNSNSVWLAVCFSLQRVIWREIRLEMITNVYYRIYRWKIRFTNAYNDFCIILGTHKCVFHSSHKYQAIWTIKQFNKCTHHNLNKYDSFHSLQLHTDTQMYAALLSCGKLEPLV